MDYPVIRLRPSEARDADSSAEIYARLRDAGPVVRLEGRRTLAIARWGAVREALKQPDVLVSGRGVADNPIVNGARSKTVLTSDGEDHRRRREVLTRPLSAQALMAARPQLLEEARRTVEVAMLRSRAGPIDLVASLASHLPIEVVSRLVGLGERGRSRMLRWAAATFDALGAFNGRAIAAAPRVLELEKFVARLTSADVDPAGWAAKLFAAEAAGEISTPERRALLIDYVAPSLDTTILASAYLLWRLARSPDLLATLKSNPDLLVNAVHESVRLGSPIRGFTRFVLRATRIEDTIIPKGRRVLILFAAANRDERKFDRPNDFDVRRGARDHLGWGYGPHACAGSQLARVEMECLLQAIVEQVSTIEVGTPRLLRNNVLQGFAALPGRLS